VKQVSVDPIDSAPFDLMPEAARDTGVAALCLHGLTGTPFEVRPVAEALRARGLRACGPRLAGHEGGVETLETRSRHDWVEGALAELDALRVEHDRIFLVGISLGGLVSLRLSQLGPVDGLVVIGTPLRLPAPIPQLVPFVRRIMPRRPKRGSDIQDPIARARHPASSTAMPLASVMELIALQREVIEELASVTAPLFVAHGRLDRTAPPRDAHRIYETVSSRVKELFWLERSGHIATVDHDAPALIRAATDFLTRIISS